jgi:hypothetical protein
MALPTLSKEELAYLLMLNKSRFSFMYGDAHGIAYLLDPRYDGDGMNLVHRRKLRR